MENIKYDVLVMGLGNVLMSDDGLGVEAVKRLQQKRGREGILILEVGTGVINYLEEISQCLKLIVIDAVRAGQKAGRVCRLREGDLLGYSEDGADAHGFSLLETVSLARKITGYPKEVIIYGVEPYEMGLGDRISPVVEKSLEIVVSGVMEEIKKEQGC